MGSGERVNPFLKWKREEEVSTTQTYDRFGRLLQTGDVVYMIAKQDIMWRVVSTRPVLDPGVPSGTVELALQAFFITGLPGGQRVADVIKVRDASEEPPTGKTAEEIKES